MTRLTHSKYINLRTTLHSTLKKHIFLKTHIYNIYLKDRDYKNQIKIIVFRPKPIDYKFHFPNGTSTNITSLFTRD